MLFLLFLLVLGLLFLFFSLEFQALSKELVYVDWINLYFEVDNIHALGGVLYTVFVVPFILASFVLLVGYDRFH